MGNHSDKPQWKQESDGRMRGREADFSRMGEVKKNRKSGSEIRGVKANREDEAGCKGGRQGRETDAGRIGGINRWESVETREGRRER